MLRVMKRSVVLSIVHRYAARLVVGYWHLLHEAQEELYSDRGYFRDYVTRCITQRRIVHRAVCRAFFKFYAII